MKKLLWVMAFLLVAGACSKDKTVDVQAVSLSETSLTLRKGEQSTLAVTVTPEHATDQTIVWSSGDERVATVTNGSVKAVAAGKTIVKAIVGNRSASCEVTVEPDVYVVGGEHSDERLDGPAYAMFWKNGAGTRLTDGKNYAAAYCICMDGATVYVGGAEMNGETEKPVYARIWKDGKSIFSETERASSIQAIAHVNGQLYAAGCVNDGTIDLPALWKDGKWQVLDHDGYDGGQLYCMKIAEADVYAGGCVIRREIIQNQVVTRMMPSIWKNGVRQDMNESAGKLTFVLGLDVAASGDVYACGYISGKAVRWKNNDMQELAAHGNAFKLFVSGSDVYTTGYDAPDFDETTPMTGRVWKNGQVLYTIPGNGYSCTPGVSQLYGTDLYTVGCLLNETRHASAKIWKNGAEYKTLTDGTKSAEANDVFVK